MLSGDNQATQFSSNALNHKCNHFVKQILEIDTFLSDKIDEQQEFIDYKKKEIKLKDYEYLTKSSKMMKDILSKEIESLKISLQEG